MGAARRSGGRTSGFIESTLKLLDEFYVGIVQNLKPWRPPAPRKEQEAGGSTDWATSSPGEEIPAEILVELGAGETPREEPAPAVPVESPPDGAVGQADVA